MRITWREAQTVHDDDTIRDFCALGHLQGALVDHVGGSATASIGWNGNDIVGTRVATGTVARGDFTDCNRYWPERAAHGAGP